MSSGEETLRADMTVGRLPCRPLARAELSLSVLGLGTTALGNLYRPIDDDQAREALDTAFDAGISFVDTAPFYGFGLAERRVGDGLRGRNDVVVSTKVGRLLDPDPAADTSVPRDGYASPMPFVPRYDYSAKGIETSLEHSLQRLGLGRVDMLLVHDIGTMTHGPQAGEMMRQLTTGGGIETLCRLRREGTIAAFGIGVNEWQIAEALLEPADLDVILLAGRYTLLEQAGALPLLGRCAQRGVGVVIGGPYNSGILATGARADAHYDYGPADKATLERVVKLEEACADYGVSLKAAALQFTLAHPAVVSVIPGMDSADHVREAAALVQQQIPHELWAAMHERGLIDPAAPLPGQPCA